MLTILVDKLVLLNWLFLYFNSKVKAEDPDADANGQIKYSIDFGNNEGYFSIEENTGNISLAKIIPLEENRILEFPLYVTARDGRSEQYFSCLDCNDSACYIIGADQH